MKSKATMVMIIGLGIFILFAGTTGAQTLPAAQPQNLLSGTLIPKFVEPLPVAGDITVVDATNDLLGVPANGYTPDMDHPFTISAEEFKAQILPSPGNWPAAPATCTDGTSSWVWGYRTSSDITAPDPRPSYLGPVVVAEKDVPFYPEWVNNLPAFSYVQQNLPIDMTLDWANASWIICDPLETGNWTDPQCGGLTSWPPYQGPVPIASHLHGGEVLGAFDGGPDAWFMPGGSPSGGGHPGPVYQYPNGQQESTIWFHDHALGITRLNVFAGLAGLYPILDRSLTGVRNIMPKFPEYDIPLIIQDRSFDDECQIFYNLASNPQPNPTVHPFWIPEFIGDTIAVNGKTWPYLEVEPRQYRFRLVNGSNARFYNLSLSRGLKMLVIATDDGYLRTAVRTGNLIIGPGERYEIIVDFKDLKMKKGVYPDVIMTNAAATPFPAGALPVIGLTDTVMQFRVTLQQSPIGDTTIAAGTPIRTTPYHQIVNGFDPVNGITRQLTLNEVIGGGGPLELVINNSKYNSTGILPGALTPLNRETELPALGDTEIWELINITADAHPMHTHLVSFQIIDRTPFKASPWIAQYDALMRKNNVLPGYGPPNPYNIKNEDGAIGGNPGVNSFLDLKNRRLPLAYEMGWKDTVIAYPGEVTRIAIRWATTETTVGGVAVGDNTYPFDPRSTDLSGGVGYVWHCHIIDHEDNEMMRNYLVGNDRQPVY